MHIMLKQPIVVPITTDLQQSYLPYTPEITFDQQSKSPNITLQNQKR
jgi:hypothetical protein